MLFSMYLKKETLENLNKLFEDLDTEGTGEIKMSEVVKMIKGSKYGK